MAVIRLLVVEDDQDGQEVVGRLLRFHRLDYDVADSAEAALSLMANNSYTGAIIDLALPKMDGWSLLDTIQTQPEHRAHEMCGSHSLSLGGSGGQGD
jgi:CheY-like chemotaxis protein